MEVMEALVGGDKPFLKTAQMEVEHAKAREKALQTYYDKNKYGRKNQVIVEKYQTILEEVGLPFLRTLFPRLEGPPTGRLASERARGAGVRSRVILRPRSEVLVRLEEVLRPRFGFHEEL